MSRNLSLKPYLSFYYFMNYIIIKACGKKHVIKRNWTYYQTFPIFPIKNKSGNTPKLDESSTRKQSKVFGKLHRSCNDVIIHTGLYYSFSYCSWSHCNKECNVFRTWEWRIMSLVMGRIFPNYIHSSSSGIRTNHQLARTIIAVCFVVVNLMLLVIHIIFEQCA